MYIHFREKVPANEMSYTEIGRHIINQSNNVIYEDRKNQVYGIG